MRISCPGRRFVGRGEWGRDLPGRTGDRRRAIATTAHADAISVTTDAPAEARAREAGVAAWLAAVPVAAITLLAMLVLGPPLGRILSSGPHVQFWSSLGVLPEPTEQARFLIALSAPLLLAALTALLVRRAEWLPSARAAIAARGAELAVVALLIACFVAQRLQAPQDNTGEGDPVVYFTLPAIAVALAIAIAVAAGARSGAVRQRAARLLADSSARRVGAALVAVVAVLVALLPAFNTDQSIAQVYEAVSYHLEFTYDEAVAVVNGRSPLGDFAAQYASLWPYAVGAGMSVLGSGLAVFTGLMAALTGLTLLALYDLLRRLSRSSVAALLLFLPLLATCGSRLHGPSVNRFSLVNYFGVMPLRYAGPFLLAWLLARHLDGARPRRTWPLFAAAGLVALNNTDFGLPALGATVAALVWARSQGSGRGMRRELTEAAAGLVAAAALVTGLVALRTGAAPDASLLFRYARIFVVEGFAMLPIKPVFGVYVAIFLTHVAAIGVATVRALRREADVSLTGMLAWSGFFGLGAFSYYVGHSLSELLIYTFPPWALSVALLTIATIRGLAASPRWASPIQLACLVAFGLLVCSLAQTPLPWQQLERIRSVGPATFAHPLGETFVAQQTRPGETVLIMAELGHRIGETLGLKDVEPWSNVRSIFTVEQLADSVRALRRNGGTKLFLDETHTYGDFSPVLRQAFALRAEREGMQLWQLR